MEQMERDIFAMEVLNLLTMNILKNSPKILKNSPKILINQPKIKFCISLHVSRNSIRSEPCSGTENLETFHGTNQRLLRQMSFWLIFEKNLACACAHEDHETKNSCLAFLARRTPGRQSSRLRVTKSSMVTRRYCANLWAASQCSFQSSSQ